MSSYEDLLELAYKLGLKVSENHSFQTTELNGLIVNKKIKISDKLETIHEKKCVLVEEIAHYLLNNGDITNLSEIDNARQEYRAHKLAVRMTISLTDIVRTAISLGEESTIYNVAEELGITEEFLEEAINIYKRTYGEKLDVGSYIIYFHPFKIHDKQK